VSLEQLDKRSIGRKFSNEMVAFFGASEQMTLDSLNTSWNFTALFSAYIGGVISSLTPCVYPLIPITLSIVGARGARTRLQSFGRASLYVAGMTITYTTLGVISARAGSLFGATFQRPAFIVPFSLLLLLLALSELDILPISFFSRIQGVASRLGGGTSRLSIAVMGGASGLVAAPCIGPILAGILGIAASSGSATWGGLLLFAYSIGLGTPFLVLGTFSDVIHHLPRSGQWLNGIKSLLAIALLVVAIRFIQPWFPLFSVPPLAAFGVGISCLFLLWRSYSRNWPLFRGIAALGFALAISSQLLYWETMEAKNDANQQGLTSILHWFDSLEEAKQESRISKKPILIDFFAEWCTACKEIDAITFADPDVKQELKEYWVLVRIDLTNSDPDKELIQQTFTVQGLPTILFIPAANSTPSETRIAEFIEPNKLLSILRVLRAS
jgi:thiol:disulfide interchange protein DsbD